MEQPSENTNTCRGASAPGCRDGGRSVPGPRQGQQRRALRQRLFRRGILVLHEFAGHHRHLRAQRQHWLPPEYSAQLVARRDMGELVVRPILQRHRQHLLRRCGQLRIVVAPLIVVVLLASACGGQEHPKLEAAGLGAALQTASAFQRERLEDGRLTYEEYESAVLATVKCLRDQGVVISVEPRPAAGNRIEFAYASTEETDARAAAAYEACYREYQNLIDAVWYQQHQPGDETIQRARQALAECLREAGAELPEQPTAADFRALALAGDPALPGCQHKVSSEFDLAESFIG